SALKSLIGNPFRAGSSLGFLSPPDSAASAGRSTPSERQQQTERTAESTDFAVVRKENRRVWALGLCFIVFSGQASAEWVATLEFNPRLGKKLQHRCGRAAITTRRLNPAAPMVCGHCKRANPQAARARLIEARPSYSAKSKSME